MEVSDEGRAEDLRVEPLVPQQVELVMALRRAFLSHVKPIVCSVCRQWSL